MKKNSAIFPIPPALVLLICLPVFAQTSPAAKPLTIEAMFAPGGLGGRGPENTTWSPDGAKLSFVQRDDAGEHGELWYVDAATGEKKVLVSAAKLASLAPDYDKVKDERERERLTRYHVAAYVWAPDSKHMIFDSQGQLWLFDLSSGTAVQFTSAPDPSGDPKFSPDGNKVSYIRKHNLYVRTVAGKNEKQLTKDTEDNLFNGDIDWVYGEELSVRSNYFWSPNSKQLAFLHMDETKVPTYPIANLIPTHPTVDNEKYPKVGDPNPVVKLGVVDADKGKVRWISLTSDEETYIPRFGWVNDGVLWAELLNRRQDTMDIYFIDAKSGKSAKVLTETQPDAWINVNDDFRVLKSGDRFLWSSWRDGHTHLYLYSFDKQNALSGQAKLERQLTQGDYEVLGVEGVDEAAGTIFFSCNKGDARQRHVFSVKLDGSDLRQLTPGEGVYLASFSDDGKHFEQTFAGPSTSPKISLCAVGGSCSPVWQSRDVVADYGLRSPHFIDFKADDGTLLHGRLLLPADAPASGKVPLIINIYGGPAAQTVLKETPGAFDELLSRQGFAIFSVDNRGTPGRDRKFQAAIRHEFGAIELKDQLTALDQLLAQYPQLDATRIAIWGWSNGGSMTLYAMTHSDRFRAGVAVAPVTNQVNYDSIYTERYMGLLKEDPKGYAESDVTASAANLHGALMLAHGTGDDNVHFQNSMQMIDALIKAGKQFRLMIYPNKTHSIAGSDARDQLFHMIDDHFEHELK
ncbi:MAG TPA: DPP IV N-terminal domain-containing protein [Candidatus Binatia bacterium]|nr:DPP IV N-terminal domain-containing protein [Candidatus Binatia bacterium]